MSAPLPVLPPQTHSLTTSDGTVLVADIWVPSGEGPYPVLLMRQAYGRRIGTSLCYAPPEWYAAHGYIVVMQDVRGRGDSTGDFVLFEHDAQDGAETVAWVAALPKSNGRVGMFGFSYQGTNQLLAAGRAPALRAVAPAMIGWDLRADWAFENDAFALAANVGWATQMAAETARVSGHHADQAALFTASRALSFAGPAPAHPAHEDLLTRHGHYARWRDTPPDDPYWARISPAAQIEAIVANGPAVLLIGGWYDSHLIGTLAAYEALADRLPARIIVGPWAHFPWDRRIGARDFGPDAVTDIDQQQIAWFDRWLKDAGDSGGAGGARLFDMGANIWREFASFPNSTTPLPLSGTGRAAIDMRDGRLGGAPVQAFVPTERLTLDPWRPAAPCGGTFGNPPGPVDRARIDARSDVLTFTTDFFHEPMLVAGAVSLQIDIATEHQSFDLHATLAHVMADGRSFALAEGYATLRPGTSTIPMRATCCTIQPGEALRLSISPACFPSFPVNPGTGQAPWNASLSDLRVTILHLQTPASHLALPIFSPAQENPA